MSFLEMDLKLEISMRFCAVVLIVSSLSRRSKF
jgi:hypothetical protein